MNKKTMFLMIIVAVLVLSLVSFSFADSFVTKASKEWKIAFVPKLIGIPYFNAMEAGGNRAECS